MNILLFINFSKNKALEVSKTVISYLHNNKCTLFSISKDITEYFNDIAIIDTENVVSCEYIITIGGDGTILDAAQLSARFSIPILGINLGKLGFLANIEVPDIECCLNKLLNKDFSAEERSGLSLLIGGEEKLSFCLNDIVLSKTLHTNIVDLDIKCNNKEVFQFSSDGLIISTSTGSTAYSLSAGGPILDPSLNTITLVPICPHSITVKPIVFGNNNIITVCSSRELSVVVDGRERYLIPPDTQITVQNSIQKAIFIRFKDIDFFEIIYSKLLQRG